MTRAGQIRDLPCEITVSEPEPDEIFGGTFREITVELARQAWTTRIPEAEFEDALEAAFHVRGALNRWEDERRHRENRAAMLEDPDQKFRFAVEDKGNAEAGDPRRAMSLPLVPRPPEEDL